MLPLSLVPEEDLTPFVLNWLGLLSRGKWTAALSMIDEPNSYGIEWTRDRIVSLVEDTFSPETRFFREFGPPYFSDPATAQGNPHLDIGPIRAEGYWLVCDIPLNGHFSELTADFKFLRRAEGFAVILQDLHVL